MLIVISVDKDYIIKLRRQIHMYPEVGYDLPITVALVKRELDSMNIPYTEKYGKGSVVAYINPDKTDFTIGIRADMDALKMTEENDCEYKSRHQILKKAVEQEIVNKNVCLSLNKIKSKHEEKRVLTDFEKECISKTDYTDKERLFINLLYYTGIRRGEALALNIRDINHNTKMLKISKSLDIRENQPVLKEPKSKAGYREIPIPDVLYQEITKYFWKNKNINLFTMKNGELMSRTSFRKMWESIIKKTKATANDLFFCEQKTLNEYMDRTIAFTPHTFRHTYATNLYYAGIDIKRCQYLLGHSSIEMTLKIYTHLYNKNNDGYFGKINNYFDITKKIC